MVIFFCTISRLGRLWLEHENYYKILMWAYRKLWVSGEDIEMKKTDGWNSNGG